MCPWEVELTGRSARTDGHVERQRRSGSLDVLGVDAELVVGPLSQAADRVDGRLRLDPRDARPRRGQVLAPLDDVGHDRRSAVGRRGEPGERHAGSRHTGHFERSSWCRRLV